MFPLILMIFTSYVIGSFPTAIIVSKLIYKTDVRDHGSGNAGATNIFRTFGWKPALFVTIVDIFKGWLPTYLISIYKFEGMLLSDHLDILMIVAGFSAVLGHTYTIFAGFKGGKGVATAAGMLIALFPIALPICIVVFILTLMSSGIVSLGSMLAATTLPIVVFLIDAFSKDMNTSSTLKIFSILIAVFIVFTHRSNITKIKNGTENKFEKAIVFKRKK
jgi:acyl phosphate:glycerol-3-phosphate acyltransferase